MSGWEKLKIRDGARAGEQTASNEAHVGLLASSFVLDDPPKGAAQDPKKKAR